MAELPGNVFTDRLALVEGIDRAARLGFAFVRNAFTDEALERMQEEASELNLELGDHVANPIYAGTPKQITQRHERAYHPVDSIEVPVASFVASALAAQGRRLQGRYPSLTGWRATEAGYQLYRDPDHHISKHRDRRNDQILAATITISGRAILGIHEPLGEPDDYTNTQEIDRCETAPGTLMFLRAQGLGSGEQVIHDVSPPIDGPRLILNLRMRPDILPSPAETASR